MNADLIEMKKSLSPQELEIFKTELERKRKSAFLAYVLFALSIFGLAGLHKFYLGKPIKGILFLVGAWAGLFAFSSVLTAGRHSGMGQETAYAIAIGTLAIPVVVVWWFVDLFTLPRQTEKTNENIERTLLHQIRQP